MNTKHIAITLLLVCSIIALNAMDTIQLIKVKPSELVSYEDLACEVYSSFAIEPEKKYAIRTAIRMQIFPHILSQKRENFHAFVASAQGKDVGFITYEVLDEKTITFHLSPIEQPCTKGGYNLVLEMIKKNYPHGCDVNAGCPDYLPELKKLLTELGFEPAEKYKCSEEYPKPADAKVPAYVLKLLAKSPNS